MAEGKERAPRKKGKSEPKARIIKVRDFWNQSHVVKLVRVSTEAATGEDAPPVTADGTPLLTRAEKMKQDYENAGEPLKGAKDD